MHAGSTVYLHAYKCTGTFTYCKYTAPAFIKERGQVNGGGGGGGGAKMTRSHLYYYQCKPIMAYTVFVLLRLKRLLACSFRRETGKRGVAWLPGGGGQGTMYMCLHLCMPMQDQVDGGLPLPTCLMMFNKWVREMREAFAIVLVEPEHRYPEEAKLCAIATWTGGYHSNVDTWVP